MLDIKDSTSRVLVFVIIQLESFDESNTCFYKPQESISTDNEVLVSFILLGILLLYCYDEYISFNSLQDHAIKLVHGV